MVTVVPGLTLAGTLKRSLRFPAGVSIDCVRFVRPGGVLAAAGPGDGSPKSMATAISTFQPTDCNTCVACDSENPIETHVLSAFCWVLLRDDELLFTTRGWDTIRPVACIGWLGLALNLGELEGGGTTNWLCDCGICACP